MGKRARKTMSVTIHKNLVKTLVGSVALYGAETWTLKQRHQNIAFEMLWCVWDDYRKLAGWEKVNNRLVFNRINEKKKYITEGLQDAP